MGGRDGPSGNTLQQEGPVLQVARLWGPAGAQHLKNIFEVCIRTPQVQHWMPTREVKLLTLMDPDVVPKNLIIRVSSHMIDQGPVKFWPHTSTVVRTGKTCPAQDQGNECGSCRQCWDKSINNVAYPKH